MPPPSETEHAFQKVALQDLCQVQSVTPGEAVTFTPASWLQETRVVHGQHRREFGLSCSNSHHSVTLQPHTRVLCSDHTFQSRPVDMNHSIVTSHQMFITCDQEKCMPGLLAGENDYTFKENSLFNFRFGLPLYILFTTLGLYLYMLVQ